jgi:hypothetical protein
MVTTESLNEFYLLIGKLQLLNDISEGRIQLTYILAFSVWKNFPNTKSSTNLFQQ